MRLRIRCGLGLGSNIGANLQQRVEPGYRTGCESRILTYYQIRKEKATHETARRMKQSIDSRIDALCARPSLFRGKAEPAEPEWTKEQK